MLSSNQRVKRNRKLNTFSVFIFFSKLISPKKKYNCRLGNCPLQFTREEPTAGTKLPRNMNDSFLAIGCSK